MRRLLIAIWITLPALALAGCTGWGVYSGGPHPYHGYYDDYYGPIYDGYWGSNGLFYFRSSEQDRHFRRGDPAHFRRDATADGRFHPMQGSGTPRAGTRLRPFPRNPPEPPAEHRRT